MVSNAELKDGRSRFHHLLDAADIVVPFTGAGISTESGIPDFRSPGGLWQTNKPIGFEAFVTSKDARCEAWRRRFVMDAVFADAKPARGHKAVAAWVRSGKSQAVITQNIDNLHQDAGLGPREVVEIHGNTTFATCLSCGLRHELPWVRERFEADGEPPACRSCNGLLKTATISFGQTMPEAEMRRAVTLSKQCDLFVALGSSLVVHPAAGLPAIAKKQGAKLVIINREETPLDALADLVVRGEIGDILDR